MKINAYLDFGIRNPQVFMARCYYNLKHRNFSLLMKISMGLLLGLLHEDRIKIPLSTPQSAPWLFRISKGCFHVSRLFCDFPSPHLFIALTAVFKLTAGYISYQNVISFCGIHTDYWFKSSGDKNIWGKKDNAVRNFCCCLHCWKIKFIVYNSLVTDLNADSQFMQEFVPLRS